MKKSFLMTCVFAVATSLVSVQAHADQTDTIRKAVSGKTLTNGGTKFKVKRNGRLTGSSGALKFKGTWTIRDGQWCRTLTEPANFAGTECQPTELGENTITITGSRGPTVYDIN